MVRVYFTPGCSACAQVKEYLKSKNIPFKEVDLTKIDPQEQQKLVSRLGQLRVPIVEIDVKKIVYSLPEVKEVYG